MTAMKGAPRPFDTVTAGATAADSVADVAERLMAELGHSVSLATVSDTVLAAYRDLAGQVPGTALAELLYRLASQRLGDRKAGD